MEVVEGVPDTGLTEDLKRRLTDVHFSSLLSDRFADGRVVPAHRFSATVR